MSSAGHPHIVALAGGVGGAKLADGLYRLLPPGALTVIVNTGDDFAPYGLRVCPDLDTVCYALGGLANPETGWGQRDESWACLGALRRLNAPTWFALGDRDLATHLERTRRLLAGEPLSAVTAALCQAWGIHAQVLPMSDDPVATMVQTAAGELEFQEYFVHQRCEPAVTGFRFAGIETARPAPGVLEALEQADGVVICPSNPWVSIGPILALPGVTERLARQAVVAVSPIVGGQALKGPAAKMYRELGWESSAAVVAEQYRAIADGFVLDSVDKSLAERVARSGIIPLVTQTVMRTLEDRVTLAHDVVSMIQTEIRRKPAA